MFFLKKKTVNITTFILREMLESSTRRNSGRMPGRTAFDLTLESWFSGAEMGKRKEERVFLFSNSYFLK
jgi:hypothetical protein